MSPTHSLQYPQNPIHPVVVAQAAKLLPYSPPVYLARSPFRAAIVGPSWLAIGAHPCLSRLGVRRLFSKAVGRGRDSSVVPPSSH